MLQTCPFFPGDGLGDAAKATSQVRSLTPDLGNVTPSPAKGKPVSHWLAVILRLIGLACAIFSNLAPVLSLNSLF